MKQLKQLGIFSVFLSGCIGPQIDTCVVLMDLKTEHCVPADPKKPAFRRDVKAGQIAYSPEDWKTLMDWIEQHKK